MIVKIIYSIYDILWSPVLIVVLIGAGILFSIKTRFVQFRRVRLMVKLLVGQSNRKLKSQSSVNGFSSFQALCVSLAGRVGAGNIVGVATAIAFGGPGAVFWMWITTLVGASTAFMESTLAQKYKFRHDKGWRGTPSCYIEEGLGLKWLACLFSVFTIIGYGILCVTVQSNSVSTAFESSFSVLPIITGLVVLALVLLVIVGGVKRIAKVASVVTPFMAIGYLLIAIVVLICNIDKIPSVFVDIFREAFNFDSITGGMAGAAIIMGVKRGLYSNEAGQGGGAIVSGSAIVEYPAQQGLVQSFSVYIDTLLICTATALMILCTNSYNMFDMDTGQMIKANVPEISNNYICFTQGAVDTVFNGFGGYFVTIALAFFVFTTLLTFCFYSESSIIYLGRSLKISNTIKEKTIIWVYRVLMSFFLILGACVKSDLVWTIGDIGLGLTTWINVIALLFLFPQGVKCLKEYEDTLKNRPCKESK